MSSGLIHGDSLEVLKTFDDNSIDHMVSDPPYGLEFMGKDWDKTLPPKDIFKECLRVLKHGSWCFIVCTPKQNLLSRMIIMLEDVGFNVDFTSIYWTYFSGFPKAGNISKLVDKKLGNDRECIGKSTTGCGNTTSSIHKHDGYARCRESIYDITKSNSPEGRLLEGSYTGFQPKPAVEVVIVCQKPFKSKTYIEQSLKYYKEEEGEQLGSTWLDDCRIPHNEKIKTRTVSLRSDTGVFNNKTCGLKGGVELDNYNKNGRFPANLLVSDDMLNDGTVSESQYTKQNDNRKCLNSNTYCFGGQHNQSKNYSDCGSNSRYFDLDKWFDDKLPENVKKVLPFLIVPKPSKKERNMGLSDRIYETVDDGRQKLVDNPYQRGKTLRQNIHPTVKPIKLMSYLITLCSRENEIILDPFCGSGTTCISAKLLNRKYIGIDLEKEHIEISKKRIDSVVTQLRLL